MIERVKDTLKDTMDNTVKSRVGVGGFLNLEDKAKKYFRRKTQLQKVQTQLSPHLKSHSYSYRLGLGRRQANFLCLFFRGVMSTEQVTVYTDHYV